MDRGNSGGPALTRDGEVAGVATLVVQEANQLQMLPILFTADATFDGLYDSCAAGDLAACDELWGLSAYGSDHRRSR
ncbi:hypothetical protein [Ornithinimicrobium sp. LYQ103]|uniref:hypothetical protein n=1 Tax=Ornithinimicrobium sp. LYQ103 TaxID=3378796 RepID=UPI0038527316